MDRVKLHCVLEQVRAEGFPYDVMDVEENSVQSILRDYGIYDEFTEEEERIILAQFKRWAEDYQNGVMIQFTQMYGGDF
jgi:hypothetical protein